MYSAHMSNARGKCINDPNAWCQAGTLMKSYFGFPLSFSTCSLFKLLDGVLLFFNRSAKAFFNAGHCLQKLMLREVCKKWALSFTLASGLLPLVGFGANFAFAGCYSEFPSEDIL